MPPEGPSHRFDGQKVPHLEQQKDGLLLAIHDAEEGIAQIKETLPQLFTVLFEEHREDEIDIADEAISEESRAYITRWRRGTPGYQLAVEILSLVTRKKDYEDSITEKKRELSLLTIGDEIDIPS